MSVFDESRGYSEINLLAIEERFQQRKDAFITAAKDNAAAANLATCVCIVMASVSVLGVFIKVNNM